jgi:transposase, IS5 family
MIRVSYFDLKKSGSVERTKQALTRENGLKPLGEKGVRPFMLRRVADQPSLWDAILPEELRQLPTELARIDALLDDPMFFSPFVQFFDPRQGRPSTPMETYLRLMF